MILPPKTELGITTCYMELTDAMLSALMHAKHDENVRDMLVRQRPSIAHPSQLLEVELVPTPEGNPELNDHMFKVRIAMGRERLGFFVSTHFKHNWETEDFGENLAFVCYDCDETLELSQESLTGITY